MIDLVYTPIPFPYPQTAVPPILLEPQTPLPLPQVPIPDPALAFELSFWLLLLLTLELDDPARSAALWSLLLLLLPKLYSGVVERLLMPCVGPCPCVEGRLPMGPIPPPTGAVVDLEMLREWPSSPVGGDGAF